MHYHSKELIENWNKLFLSDIQVKMNGEKCPDGYEVLFSSSYEGSTDVCNCLNREIVQRRKREAAISLQIGQKDASY